MTPLTLNLDSSGIGLLGCLFRSDLPAAEGGVSYDRREVDEIRDGDVQVVRLRLDIGSRTIWRLWCSTEKVLAPCTLPNAAQGGPLVLGDQRSVFERARPVVVKAIDEWLQNEPSVFLHSLSQAWLEVVQDRYEVSYRNPCIKYAISGEALTEIASGSNVKAKLDELNLREDDIGEAEIDKIIDSNKFKFPRPYVVECSKISVGIRDAKGQLVGWCLTHSDMSLSSLYVIPPLRGKGLSTILLTRMGEKHLDLYAKYAPQQPVYLHLDVETWNMGAMKAFERAGWNAVYGDAWVQITGPIATAAIVVPTIAHDDSGLPHTLEHLVFCGSKNYPQRGYLDNLANRSLSTGTNAYTCEDHTGYTINAAGQEGLRELLPVFLDHVLHPTLTQEQFMTEVYHVDGQGKQQGVVFSEMASRENSEADLLDLNLRRLIYSKQSTYHHECGGLTPDIAKLTNEQIKAYHERFYHLDNITIVLTGDALDVPALFERLEKEPGLLEVKQPSDSTHRMWVHQEAQATNAAEFATKTIRFPSADNSIGSIGYAWHGPDHKDLRTLVALDVLFRYLHETPASPFYQKFVDGKSHFCSQVDFEIKPYLPTSILLLFSGVQLPEKENSETAMDGEDEDGSEEETDEEDISEDEDDGSIPDSHQEEDDLNNILFEPRVFYQLVKETIEDFVGNGHQAFDNVRKSISRTRIKILESLEDDPHEVITGYLVGDIVNNRFRNEEFRSTDADRIGTRRHVFDILQQLENEPPEFWTSLAKRWLLDASVGEVQMIPSPELGKELEGMNAESLEKRRCELGEDGLKICAERLQQALAANEIHIGPAIRETMPPIPDIKHVSRLKETMFVQDIPYSESIRPFKTLQTLSTDTAFVNLKLCLPLTHIAPHLRPYLVLFQELLFQSSLSIPSIDGAASRNVDYRDLSRLLNQDLVFFESAVGFGNDTFACSWLSELFCLAGSSTPENFTKLVRWIVHILMFSVFEPARIRTIARNLLSDCSSLKREGGDCASLLSTRLTTPLVSKEKSRIFNTNRSSSAVNHDNAISVFQQESFLRYIVEHMKQDDTSETVQAIISNLNSLRLHILTLLGEQQGSTPIHGFLQLAYSFAYAQSHPHPEDVFLATWDAGIQSLKEVLIGSNSSQSPKRKRSDSLDGQSAQLQVASAFPFPRSPYQPLFSETQNIHVPHPSLTSSYLISIAPCDIVAKVSTRSPAQSDLDYYATILLCEYLSRNEGPLYTSIRGNGYAYDATISTYLWTGQLAFEIRDAVDPAKATKAFIDTLDHLDKEWDTSMDSFDIETSRASCLYKFCLERSTVGGLIGSALRSSLKGFATLQDQYRHHELIYKVQKTDLRRVFDVYFKQFLTGTRLVTILLTPPADSGVDYLRDMPKQAAPYAVHFQQYALDDFAIEYTP